jgi:putative flippase GtrA
MGLRMFTWERFQELFRFGATGFFCLALNTGGVMFLTERLGLYYLVSLVVSSSVVMTVGFLINKFWTFRVSNTAAPPEFARYILTNCAAMLLSVCLCSWLVADMHIPYSWAVVTAGIVCAPLTYLTHRAWTFGLTLFYGKAVSQ